MAWEYADFDDEDLYPTSRDKIRRARKFLRELRDAVGPEVAKDGASRGSASINALIESTERRIDQLRQMPDAEETGSIGRTRLG